NLVPTLENLRQESRCGNCGLWLSGCRHSSIPGAVRLCGNGGGQPPHSSLQPDGSSDCGLDVATATRSDSWWPWLSVLDSRSRFDFLLRSGRGGAALVWVESLTNARTGAAGECLLRTTDRNLATGVPGLHDPAERTPPAADPALL